MNGGLIRTYYIPGNVSTALCVLFSTSVVDAVGRFADAAARFSISAAITASSSMNDSTARVQQQHPTPQYIWLLRV
jgi:hypothetical protein